MPDGSQGKDDMQGRGFAQGPLKNGDDEKTRRRRPMCRRIAKDDKQLKAAEDLLNGKPVQPSTTAKAEAPKTEAAKADPSGKSGSPGSPPAGAAKPN